MGRGVLTVGNNVISYEDRKKKQEKDRKERNAKVKSKLKLPQDSAPDERLTRIRASLDRINKLMKELSDHATSTDNNYMDEHTPTNSTDPK